MCSESFWDSPKSISVASTEGRGSNALPLEIPFLLIVHVQNNCRPSILRGVNCEGDNLSNPYIMDDQKLFLENRNFAIKSCSHEGRLIRGVGVSSCVIGFLI